MVRKGLAATAAALIMVATPALAEATAPHEFSVSGETYSVSLPEGFCLPVGAEVALSEEIASYDKQGLTLVDLNRCGTYGEDYIQIKTPRASQPVPLPKAMFLPLLAREFENAKGQALMNDAMDKAARQLNDATENTITIEELKPRYTGRDADCVYLSATGKVAVGGESVPLVMGACMTVVGRRFMTIGSYALLESGMTEEQLTARSAAMARAITRVPPKK